MPIPGPPLTTDVTAPTVNPTGSPYWLSVNGVWLQVEGIVPSVTAGLERPRSALTSMDGNRFEQRAKVARRSWSWSLPFAAAQHVAALRAAVDSDADVWLMTDYAGVTNMLPTAGCFGSVLPALDCGGVPLGTFAGGEVIVGRVRGGVPTTLSAWSDLTDPGEHAAQFDYPGFASMGLWGDPSGRLTQTVTPAEDGDIVITVSPGARTSGLMLTEGTPADVFIAGEGMPCKVVIDDPEDVLRMQYEGTWIHDYTISLREVG